jgi:hypothetical protein
MPAHEEVVMKSHHSAVLFALTLVALAAGAGAPAATPDAGCPPTKAVFYTSDTQVLAKTLAANASDCADYYVSISPVTTAPNVGEPRSGPALAAVHAQGPRFHALAELRPSQWTAYAAANGWYAAGAKLHDDMLAAGYDPASGDTWAVNEVGTPSNSTFATNVIDGTDGARDALRDFVRGLYTGSNGPALPGLVFAANPPQLAPDVAGYAQELAGWYADAPFWEDMHRYVSMWAQETYADARAWGVAGAPLAERTAYLDDYLLHAQRVAEEGNDATDAARSFLDDAYVPLANASYRYPSPAPFAGPGFGYTDIGPVGMQRFISAQTYALRSAFGTRLGFAVVPVNDSPNRPAIEGRVAAAIHDSQSDPAGACTSTGESCDFDAAGASFADSWKALANTQEGSSIVVQIDSGVSVSYGGVDARGATWFSSDVATDAPPGWDADGRRYDIATTALTTPPVGVCLGTRTGHVFQRTDAGWHDVTTSPGCGSTDSLGTFARFVDPTPPVLVPHVAGPHGNGDWYVGDVMVSWDVSDIQSGISAEQGCATVTVSADTTGTTFTCTATSEGGTATDQVVVKRDATPPAVTCVPTPSVLWPPNGKLDPVTVNVAVSDATSGEAGFVLSDVPATDEADFAPGTADVEGLLRATRPGNGGDRTYTLTYTGRDAAGNVADCRAVIVVPHDQGD